MIKVNRRKKSELRRIYVYNTFIMLSQSGIVIPNFFANYKSHVTYALVASLRILLLVWLTFKNYFD